MDEEEARSIARGLLERSQVAFLSTIGEDGSPQTRAVENLRCGKRFPHLAPLFESHGDDFWIVISTNTSSNKVKEVRANPAAAVYLCDTEEYAGVMFSGSMEMVEGMTLKEAMWHESWNRYYPQGVYDPDFTVLSMNPLFGKCYRRLEKAVFSI
jgi:general stress protein 26